MTLSPRVPWQWLEAFLIVTVGAEEVATDLASYLRAQGDS